MSSLLTNSGAMTALQTLRNVNKGLAKAQDNVATGKVVNNSKDNASLWSIATTMDSDADGYKALATSLSLSKSVISTARIAAEDAVELMGDLRDQLVAATQPDAIFSEIEQSVNVLRDQIFEVIDGAQVNGTNLLTNTTGTTENFTLALNRTSPSTVSQSTMSITGAGYAKSVYTEDTATTIFAGAADGTGGVAGGLNATTTAATAEDIFLIEAAVTGFAIGTEFRLTLDGQTVSVKKSTGSTADSIIQEIHDKLVDTQDAGRLSGFTFATVPGGNAATGNLQITHANAKAYTFKAFTPSATTALADLAAITVTDETDAMTRIGEVETMLNAIKVKAAELGAKENRVSLQTESLMKLRDSLIEGKGSLVDADMEAEAARLQALQVQQQLAVQALSIANQAPQSILTLFR